MKDNSIFSELLTNSNALDEYVVKEIIAKFKPIFDNYLNSAIEKETDPIEQEVKNYKLELEAELKGKNIISFRKAKRRIRKKGEVQC